MKTGFGSAMQKAEQYQGKVTPHLVITSITAAIGGLIFGYIGLPGTFPLYSFKNFQHFLQVLVLKRTCKVYVYFESNMIEVMVVLCCFW
ncbi:hypothetical protein PanWU01x14_105070 [Parasponia andersonii]|uniref:Uncharacterized protein n=1 Tax=Parasponia andersonii TaxID=3476 RepID=A0A2P5D1E5_PARAD|nr:hypothetical protein PanWU01x14_105070 [Parasponia andersonii]